MTTCDRFEVVVIPFPFVDVAVTKPRPALVVSQRHFNRDNDQTIFAMITTAARSHWPSDLTIADLGRAGLRAPSVVRFKLFTLPNALIARVIGKLSPDDQNTFAARLAIILV